MKQSLNAFVLSLLLISVAPQAVMSSSGGGHSMGHVASRASQQNVIGTMTIDGITATAELSDVREAMTQAGQTLTHHLQVAFKDLATNHNIEEGVAALKVILPNGEELAPSEMLGMDGHFGVDLQLTLEGKHTFKVGTRLEDSKVRQFVFITDLN